MISDHCLECHITSDDGDTLSGARHVRLLKMPRHQHARSAEQRNHNRRVLASLRFMYRCGVGELQLVRLFERIVCEFSFLKLHGDHLGIRVDAPDHAEVSVEYTHTALRHDSVDAADFPLHLVIVADLHDLVALAEDITSIFPLGFVRYGRVQELLQKLIQIFHTECTFPHRSQNLDILRAGIHITRQFLGHQRHQHFPDHVDIVPFQKEEIFALIVQYNLFPIMDLMCIDNNIALGCLPENVRQADNRKAFLTDQIPEDTARADTWKLVLVSH